VFTLCFFFELGNMLTSGLTDVSLHLLKNLAVFGRRNGKRPRIPHVFLYGLRIGVFQKALIQAAAM
jgi:hypothetical protein